MAKPRLTLAVACALRDSGHRVVLDPLPAKSLKGQMRRAHDLHARFVLILGEEEITRGVLTLKRMSDGAQATFADADLEARLLEMAGG